MTDRVAAHQMTHFFSQVLGVVAGALERLRHEQDVEAFRARRIIVMLEMAHEDEITQAIHFGIGTQHRQCKVEIALP